MQVSYFEIYNEKIHDLLVSSGNSTIRGQATKQVVRLKTCGNVFQAHVLQLFKTDCYFQLRVREHPELGPYVEGLST